MILLYRRYIHQRLLFQILRMQVMLLYQSSFKNIIPICQRLLHRISLLNNLINFMQLYSNFKGQI